MPIADTSSTPSPAPQQRVVILGGGPAGVAAAYWLTAPEQAGRYAVTLYSQGWRLGGKCASGRDAGAGNRIEEHGLHLLMGCYQNGFATLRSLYAEWRKIKVDPLNPFQVWTDAFLPQRLVSMMEQDGPGTPPTWVPWNFPFPKFPGEPGDGPLTSVTPPAAEGGEAMIRTLVDWLDAQVPAAASFRASLAAALQLVLDVLDPIAATHPGPAQAALLLAAADIQASLHRAENAAQTDAVGVQAVASDQALTSILQRIAILADLGVAVVIGYLRDIFQMGPGAFGAIDGQDFRAWLAANGASATTLASAPVRSIYDLAFAATGGNVANGESMAAGASLRAQLEMVLGYRDAPLWKMAAGMGDTVFTPFWDVLQARDVDIRLFSRVVAMRPGAAGTLGEIDISVQAATVGDAPYRPFTRVANLDCWPDQPDWNQLVDGATLQQQGVDFEKSWCATSTGPPQTLVAGRDFDLAIVAMPPLSLQKFAGDLIGASPPWQAAIAASASVPTQSLQLWLQPTLEQLGWTDGTTVLTAFTEPYDSWGDMSQVIGRETWPAGKQPGSIAYFCGCLDVPKLPVAPRFIDAEAAAQATSWLSGNITTLWPDAGSFPAEGVLSRYDLANFDVSDQYVQTPAGINVESRLDPARPAGFANLYAVGDWTKTRFSGGCFESAIESAMLASRAISGFPQAIKT